MMMKKNYFLINFNFKTADFLKDNQKYFRTKSIKITTFNNGEKVVSSFYWYWWNWAFSLS